MGQTVMKMENGGRSISGRKVSKAVREECSASTPATPSASSGEGTVRHVSPQYRRTRRIPNQAANEVKMDNNN